jgi:hypothetical protein
MNELDHEDAIPFRGGSPGMSRRTCFAWAGLFWLVLLLVPVQWNVWPGLLLWWGIALCGAWCLTDAVMVALPRRDSRMPLSRGEWALIAGYGLVVLWLARLALLWWMGPEVTEIRVP